jgi:hypothetical protein
MATVTVQTMTRAGIAPTYNAASGGGDKFAPGRDTYVHIKNGGGGSITATFAVDLDVEDLAVADATVTVPAGAERIAGPFSAHLFEDSADGLVHVAWSGTTSVTFAVVKPR